ncbi:MAG: hypothetical protein Q8S24_00055 [Eubacteriales bacterium]|nr:hypothetical protein [Eubacteriales bacterium]
MFNIFTKASYVGTLYEGDYIEAMVLKDTSGSKIVVYLGKTDEAFELVKTGKWIFVKLYAQAKSKIKLSGNVFTETRIYLDKARELDESETASLENELRQIALEKKTKNKSIAKGISDFSKNITGD